MLLVVTALFVQVRRWIERQAAGLITRLLTLRLDLARKARYYQTRRLIARQSETKLPAWQYTLLYVGQGGYSTVGVLITAGILVFGLALFATRGLPEVYKISSNTTAMTTAGMSTDAIQWVTWGLWGLILIVIGGVVFLIINKHGHMGAVSGGGGGGGRRRRR